MFEARPGACLVSEVTLTPEIGSCRLIIRFLFRAAAMNCFGYDIGGRVLVAGFSLPGWGGLG